MQRDLRTVAIYSVVWTYLGRRVIHRERCRCKMCADHGPDASHALQPNPLRLLAMGSLVKLVVRASTLLDAIDGEDLHCHENKPARAVEGVRPLIR